MLLKRMPLRYVRAPDGSGLARVQVLLFKVTSGECIETRESNALLRRWLLNRGYAAVQRVSSAADGAQQDSFLRKLLSRLTGLCCIALLATMLMKFCCVWSAFALSIPMLA